MGNRLHIRRDKKVPALDWFEEMSGIADCQPDGADRSGALLSQELLELGEGYLYRVKIRSIGRREKAARRHNRG
jgi:hypothetical protein